MRTSLFESVKLTKNADIDKYKISGSGFGFDARGSFSLSDGNRFGKNVIIFGVDMSSSVYTDNRKKDILIIHRGPTQRLDNFTLTAEKENAINFSEQQKKFC